jgi:hypothetical protein
MILAHCLNQQGVDFWLFLRGIGLAAARHVPGNGWPQFPMAASLPYGLQRALGLCGCVLASRLVSVPQS